MLHTMTEQQATQKAEEYAHGAMATLPPEARVKPMYSPQSPCDDPTDNGPRGRIEVGRDYWIYNLTDDARRQYVATLRQYWRDHRFQILTDRQQQGDYFISVENDTAGFRLMHRGNRVQSW